MTADGPRGEAAPARWSPSPVLARVLGGGARLSVLLLAVGLAWALLAGLRGGNVLTPHAAWEAVRDGKPLGLLGLGLVLLIATPVAREIAALVLFARRGEQAYVLVSALVLSLLALSLAIAAL